MSKEKKGRDCPALGTTITPAECGEKRMSELRCPKECPHNSFGPSNIGLFGKIEERVLERMQQRLYAELDEVPDDELAERLEFEGRSDPMTAHAVYMEAFLHRRDQAGKSFLDRWQGRGWEGLKNDERVMAGALSSLRPALLEMRCVRDSQTVEAVDLFDDAPGTLAIVDDVWAGRARRFSVCLGWRYDAPFFARTCGPSLRVPNCGRLDPMQVLQAVATHLGGPTEKAELREWLWRNLGAVSEVLNAINALQALTPDNSSERKRLRLRQEVPASLLEQLVVDESELTLEAWRANYAAFADQAHPLLDMKTPREASADVVLRPALVSLMKHEVSLADEARYRVKLDVDLNDMLIGLGLQELVLPPPPLPDVSEEDAEAMIEEEDGRPTVITQMLDVISLRGISRAFRQPPVKQRALQMDDIEARSEEFARMHKTQESATRAFGNNWPGIEEAVEAMTEDTLDEQTFAILRFLLAKAGTILHPEFQAAPRGEPQRLAWNLRAEMEKLTEMADDEFGDEQLTSWYILSVQPALAQRLCAEALLLMEDMQLDESLELTFAVLALIKATITEMCYWPVTD